jgi:hypothetical protein
MPEPDAYGGEGMTIEVLCCKNCRRLVISIDSIRQTTDGPDGHGGSKCAGQWRVLAVAESSQPVSEREERP